MGLKKKLIFLFKIGVLALCIYFLYAEVFQNKNIHNYRENLLHVLGSRSGVITVFLVMGLMILNWMLEAFKWQFLMKKVHHFSLWKSFKAVFMGITASVVTPNRVGEVVGRLFQVPKKNIMVKAIVINVVGSASQLLTTILFGTSAILGLLLLGELIFNFSVMLHSIILAVFSFISVTAIWIYFNPTFFINKLLKIKRLQRFFEAVELLKEFSKKELAKTLSYSVIRYIVFVTQFFLLLNLFYGEVNMALVLCLIAVMYLVTTFVPTLLLSELGLRESIAIVLLGGVFPEKFMVFAATFMLWLINLGIPSLIGGIFLIMSKRQS